MKFKDYIKQNYAFNLDESKIEDAIALIRNCKQMEIPIVVAGNGGSGYSGSHFAQDLAKACYVDARSLNDSSGLYSAISNDLDHDLVFVEMLYRIKGNFLFIPISFSGESTNLFIASRYVKRERELPVLSFTGKGGTIGKEYSNINVAVPSSNIYVVESVHSILFHYIIDTLKVG